MSIPRSLSAALLASLAFAASTAVADQEAQQRERIAGERAAIERDAKAAQAACASTFAVNACVDRVKAERHQKVQTLDRQRAALDDEARKRRAAERLTQIELRKAEIAQRTAPASAPTRQPAASAASPRPAARSAAAAEAAHEAAALEANAAAAQRAQQAAQRAADAQAHRRAVEQRNRERAKVRAPAKPLPLPAALAPGN